MPGEADARIRLLVLVSFAPRLDAPHAGSAIAAFLCRLAERHDVALVCFHEPGERVDDDLRDRCAVVEEIARPLKPSSLLRERATRALKLLGAPPDRVARTRSQELAERARAVAAAFQPQVIQCEFVEMAQYLEELEGVRARRVVVDHDPGFSAASDYSESGTGLRRLSRRLDAVAWERFSRRAFRRADRIVVFTERDRDNVLPLAGRTPVERIPFAVGLPDAALDARGAPPPTVLFFGDYLHPPNADAALRLIRAIMPRVRQAHPDAVLELVGAHPTTEMASSAGTGDHIRGVVASLTPHLEQAAVVAVPLRLGGGMRVKVLETLGAGKALVASSRALEGLELTEGVHVLTAERDDEFAAAVSSLLADEGSRIALGSGARRWAESELGWDRTVAAYETLYGELLAGRE